MSDDRRRRGRSVGEQERECRDFCEDKGWHVERLFSDPRVSASRYARGDRPGFAALMAYVADGGADAISVWENSRGTRRLREWLDVRDLCERLGVLFAYSGRVYDMRDPDDRQRATEDAVRAEGESETTRKRVLRSVRANAAAGRPHGKNLFGYRREYDPETRDLVDIVEVPEQADAVREAARRVLAGEACRAIALDFNSRGVPAPGRTPWTLENVKRVLVNPAYAGKRVHQGEVIGDADWPPIFDEDREKAAATSTALRVRLLDPTRRTNRETSVRWLLTGIVECGPCGTPMGVLTNRGKWISYVCKSKFDVTRKVGEWQPDGGPLTGVDDLVVRVVLARLRLPDALDALRPTDDTANAAGAEARRLRGELDEAELAYASGRIRLSALERRTAELAPVIERAERASQPRDVPAVVAELAGKEDAAERWVRLSMPQRRVVVRTLMRVRILPTRRGARFDGSGVEIGWRTADGVMWDSLDLSGVSSSNK